MATVITAQVVNELRTRTGAGLMDCKKALVETDGDMDAAAEILRKKGAATRDKKAGRSASQGTIASYIHLGGRIGVLVEVNCESDFVAKNELFQSFARDVAMHIAAAAPRFITREEVPAEEVAKEAEIVKAQCEGKPAAAIEKIVEQLRLALPFAENDAQRAIIEKLIAYYETGDLKTFDAYSILWVEDTTSEVDFVNGFIETYGDPLGMKASWESTVNFINKEATKRTKVISDNAQWFEDHSPVDKRFKKEAVKGVSAKVITVSMLGGDCYPATPIGINLPNADWIRRDHGSKSVTIENITEAYDKAAQGNGFNEEFVWSDKERDAMKRYGFLTDNLHTDLHECLGHGSGKLLENTDPNALKAYSSTLEEARADLFGLYYLADPKLVELGLLPDAEAYESEYYKYVMNGLMTQLVRIELGKDVEEAHMRNRQLIAKWVYEQGKADNVIELRKREGKTYVVVNDYPKLRALFGKLLAEVQRIKSEGDFEAGKNLVEGYGVKVDPELHAEVLERYAHLNLAPYKGFVNPVMREVKNEKGEVTDIVLDYTEGYVEQMLRYSRDYSFLPTYND